MKNNILIIAAMQEEMDYILTKLENVTKIEHSYTELYEATYAGQNIILSQCMIGKVNSAKITNELITKFAPKLVINIGTSGAVNPELNVGDIVIGSEMVYGDVDVRVFGYEFGQVPGMPATYKSSITSTIDIAKLNEKFNFNIINGNIATTDTFMDLAKAEKALAELNIDIDVMEMEATAIAQVCHLEKVDFLILRSVSDKIIGENNNAKEFKDSINEVSINCASVCLEVISAY